MSSFSSRSLSFRSFFGPGLFVRGFLTALLVAVPASGLSAQETGPDPQQPATETVETKSPSPSDADTASIVADIRHKKDVSAHSLRQLRIPDELLRTVSSDLHVDLKYMNRKITRFRAQILGDLPADRAADTAERIER